LTRGGPRRPARPRRSPTRFPRTSPAPTAGTPAVSPTAGLFVDCRGSCGHRPSDSGSVGPRRHPRGPLKWAVTPRGPAASRRPTRVANGVEGDACADFWGSRTRPIGFRGLARGDFSGRNALKEPPHPTGPTGSPTGSQQVSSFAPPPPRCSPCRSPGRSARTSVRRRVLEPSQLRIVRICGPLSLGAPYSFGKPFLP
jgi:hypothetical protein